MARKPFSGTVASNIAKHGTGALNIDGCRVGTTGGGNSCPGGERCKCAEKNEIFGATKHPKGGDADKGRWPANVVLEESTAEIVDSQSGYSKDGVAVNRNRIGDGSNYDASSYRITKSSRDDQGYGGEGGASRFFYVAKAPKGERPKVDGVAHPTVKPLALMRWLVRLVTPEGGVVLDPFAGSGATVEAALLEGMSPIGIEREADYVSLIQARIERSTKETS